MNYEDDNVGSIDGRDHGIYHVPNDDVYSHDKDDISDTKECSGKRSKWPHSVCNPSVFCGESTSNLLAFHLLSAAAERRPLTLRPSGTMFQQKHDCHHSWPR